MNSLDAVKLCVKLGQKDSDQLCENLLTFNVSSEFFNKIVGQNVDLRKKRLVSLVKKWLFTQLWTGGLQWENEIHQIEDVILERTMTDDVDYSRDRFIFYSAISGYFHIEPKEYKKNQMSGFHSWLSTVFEPLKQEYKRLYRELY